MTGKEQENDRQENGGMNVYIYKKKAVILVAVASDKGHAAKKANHAMMEVRRKAKRKLYRPIDARDMVEVERHIARAVIMQDE